jgi:hypothetical protein
MKRFRVYLVSTIGGLAGAFAVLGISSYFERDHLHRAIEHVSTAPPPIPEGAAGAFWGSASVYYGPSPLILYLAILLFAAIFYFLLRWQDRETGTPSSHGP